MSSKLIGFLLFFFFGSTIISAFSSILYRFLVKGNMYAVVPCVIIFAAIPLVGLVFHRIVIIGRPVGLEEVAVGGLLMVLIATFLITVSISARHQLKLLKQRQHHRSIDQRTGKIETIHWVNKAEREGFEPSIGLSALYSLSRRVPSATRPSLRRS